MIQAGEFKDEKEIKASDTTTGGDETGTAIEPADDEEEHSRKEPTENVFARPLVYYKRNTPFLRGKKRERGPTQIIWPDKTVRESRRCASEF